MLQQWCRYHAYLSAGFHGKLLAIHKGLTFIAIMNIIIVGAGAAGLMAAKELSGKGYNVIVLEAASQAGGRMHTITEDGFDMPVETGAEFIHGKVKLTLSLLKEAGIPYTAVEGDMIPVRNGKWHEHENMDAHWNEFMRKLKSLKEDVTVQHFLDEHFNEPQYASLRKAVQRYAEGYDLADIGDAAVLALAKEWSHEQEEQYRIEGGYIKLTQYLYDCCIRQHVVFQFSTRVTNISCSENAVTVFAEGKTFTANKVIVTVSAGVLQSGDILFSPDNEAYKQAIQQLGFGTVIKILLQFKTNFWQAYADDIGFILSDEAIPTWWTQLPSTSAMLTGWLGGPKAMSAEYATEEQVLQLSLQSLSNIFSRPVQWIAEQLTHSRICYWKNNPYVKGGYSYNTLSSDTAKKTLSTPYLCTLYFAGEALYTGDEQGTVEAALQSGKAVAEQIMNGE